MRLGREPRSLDDKGKMAKVADCQVLERVSGIGLAGSCQFCLNKVVTPASFPQFPDP